MEQSVEKILNEIRELKGYLKEYMKYHELYQKCHYHPIYSARLLYKIIVFCILVGLLAQPSLQKIANNEIFMLSYFVFIIFLVFVYPKIALQNHIKKNQPQIEEYQKLMDSVKQKIQPQYIPDNYLNMYALNKLESYFVNKRADTLKEALNLFEEEKRFDEQMKEINTIKQLQQKTLQEARETKVASWLNLYK